MASRTARSLRHEYGLHIEHEIENYKESIPRSAILAIGDEAATKLAADPQFALTELLLLDEVDRIIFRRLRLPSYNTWKRKRLRLHEEMRRPEHWGLSPDDALVRSIEGAADSGATSHVLVAGEAAERSALFLAANGCEVTAIEAKEESVQRVMEAAIQAGFAERVHALAGELDEWVPVVPLHAVICSHSALKSLSVRERARVLAVLQSATTDGGVHLVETIAAGSAVIDELRATYSGWNVSVETNGCDEQVFLARKEQPNDRVSH